MSQTKSFQTTANRVHLSLGAKILAVFMITGVIGFKAHNLEYHDTERTDFAAHYSASTQK